MSIRLLRMCLLNSCALSLVALAAGASPQTWGVQYGTPNNDIASDVVPDGSGGTFLTGQTGGSLFGPNQSGTDVFVVRTASDGTPLWATQFGTQGNELTGGLAHDGAGGVFVAGSNELAGTTMGRDGFLTRVDGQGQVLWTVYEGTSGEDEFHAAAPDGSGGVFAVGTTEDPGGGLFEFRLWVVHFDAAGGVLWSRSHNLFFEDLQVDAVADGQGGLFLGGTGDEVSVSDSEAFVCRLSPAGDLIWTRKLDTFVFDGFRSVALDGSGGVFAAGITFGDLAGSQGGSDILLARYDGSGGLLWLRQLGTGGGDQCAGASEDGQGGVALAGSTTGDLAGTNTAGSDCWLMTVDSTGTVTWSDQFGASFSDPAVAVCSVGPQTVAVAGFTDGALFGPYPGGGDAWIASRDICQPQPPTNYCVASPNSAGPGATIALAGTLDLSYDDLELSIAGGPPGQIGVFIMGSQTASVPFGNGVLCLGGSISRLLPGQVVDGSGVASLALDPGNPTSAASQITAGSTWNFQFWYRDPPAGGAQFNLSDGLSATFCP